jgi:hypothetical protein
MLPFILTVTILTSLPATPGTVPPPEVTASSLLGVEVGMAVAEARVMLGTLGTAESRPTREGGVKEVWRLTRTGFAWVAFKADSHGRIVWLTGQRRPGHEVPFDAVGAVPRMTTDDTAVWTSTGRFAPQRLTLRGRHRVAQVLTLSAVN